MKPGEHWRTKMRKAIEAEANTILGVVGIMSAIWAWREWQLEGQCEYIRVELQGMMARQNQHVLSVEAKLIAMTDWAGQLESHVDLEVEHRTAELRVELVAARADVRKLRAAVGQLRSIARMTLPEGPSAPLANSIRKVLAETAWVDGPP